MDKASRFRHEDYVLAIVGKDLRVMGPTDEDRRRFIARAGKVAIATPATLGLLLAADSRNYAMAISSRQKIEDIFKVSANLSGDPKPLGGPNNGKNAESDFYRLGLALDKADGYPVAPPTYGSP